MANLLPSVGHIPVPWVIAYDIFLLTTLDEKRSFWEEAATNGYVLMLKHDPANDCCTLERMKKG